MKIRTLEQLSDKLSEELAWRKKELSMLQQNNIIVIFDKLFYIDIQKIKNNKKAEITMKSYKIG